MFGLELVWKVSSSLSRFPDLLHSALKPYENTPLVKIDSGFLISFSSEPQFHPPSFQLLDLG